MFVTALLNTITIKRYVPILLCCLSLASCGTGGGVGAVPAAGSAPTASSVTITDSNGGSVVVGDALVGSYIYSDTDGDVQGVSTFRWLRNGVAIAGATASIYTVVAADSGNSITFEVTPVAATGVTSGLPVVSLSGVAVSQITAVTVASRTICTAPCGIMFDATNTTSTTVANPFYDLNYKWDYGDAAAIFNQRPGINANKSSSPIGAHVYDKAGTYIATLTVSDSAGSIPAVKNVTIIVKDPNVTYAGQTYCVSNTNNFTACPTQNPQFHFSSFDSAAVFMAGLRISQVQPVRVLFRSGETFAVSIAASIKSLRAPLLISSYDVGAKPVIKPSTSILAPVFSVQDSDGVTIANLNISGNYSPVTGMGNHPTGIFFYLGASNSLVYRDRFSGMGINVFANGGVDPASGASSDSNMVVDNFMTDWQNLSIFGSFGLSGTVLANTVKQNSNAHSGSEGKCGACLPNFPDHGPIRVATADHMLIQYNDMFNNAGWSSFGLAHQANIRLGTNGSVTKSVVADNTLEGGFAVLSMEPASNKQAIKGEVIIERNKFTATANTVATISLALGGSTIRNNLFIKPDNGSPPPGLASGLFESAIAFGVVVASTPENLTFVNRIYNNTFVSLARAGAPNVTLVQVVNDFTSFDIFNNIVYTPFAVGGANAGLLDWKYGGSLTNVHEDNNLLFSPNTSNYVFNNGISEPLGVWQASGNGIHSLTTDPLLTAPGIFDFTLTASSPAIDAGRNLAGIMTDFTNKPRSATVDIGALEF